MLAHGQPLLLFLPSSLLENIGVPVPVLPSLSSRDIGYAREITWPRFRETLIRSFEAHSIVNAPTDQALDLEDISGLWSVTQRLEALNRPPTALGRFALVGSIPYSSPQCSAFSRDTTSHSCIIDEKRSWGELSSYTVRWTAHRALRPGSASLLCQLGRAIHSYEIAKNGTADVSSEDLVSELTTHRQR